MSTINSTAPGVFAAFYALIRTAAASYGSYVDTYQFYLGTRQGDQYVLARSIENHTFDPEAMNYLFQEHYDICGEATYYTGASPSDDPSVADDVLTATYALFNAVVMTPFITNRDVPLFGVSSLLTPYRGLPVFARFAAQPGDVGGGQAGITGTIEWAYHFDALVAPAG